MLPAADRAVLVAALRAVDHVVVFEEDDVGNLLRSAAARRALQGDRLHRRHRARARDRALLRGPRRDRRRSQGPRHAPAAGQDPLVKALVVRLSSIGDVVHTLPALAALRRAGWEAGWLVEPPARVLLEGNPAVSEVFAAPPAKAFGWQRRARDAARAASAPLRRRARLPGPLEVRRLGAPLGRRARRRLAGGLTARAGVAAADRRARVAQGRRPSSRDRQEPRAARAARDRGRRRARVPAAAADRVGRPRRRGARGARRERARHPQPRRRLGEQAVAGRALRRAGAGAARVGPASARELGSRRAGPRRSRGGGLGRSGRALVPDDRSSTSSSSRAARGSWWPPTPARCTSPVPWARRSSRSSARPIRRATGRSRLRTSSCAGRPVCAPVLQPGLRAPRRDHGRDRRAEVQDAVARRLAMARRSGIARAV